MRVLRREGRARVPARRAHQQTRAGGDRRGRGALLLRRRVTTFLVAAAFVVTALIVLAVVFIRGAIVRGKQKAVVPWTHGDYEKPRDLAAIVDPTENSLRGARDVDLRECARIEKK